jgi:L-rhamnonate dehydratase
MKIEEIRAAAVDIPVEPKTRPRVPRQEAAHFTNPMNRYPELERARWARSWTRAAVIVTAEDGTWGFGLTMNAGPVVEIVNGHLSQVLVGQDVMATEKLFDLMRRATASYGTPGLASYAISAIDLALWDLKGKILKRPVYELLGGPQKERIRCYASATDTSYGLENSMAWFLELGFKAVKLFLPSGAEAGLDTIRRTEEMVARTREQIGPDVELAVDGYLSLDVETTVRLAEALRPYRIWWLEDYLLPEELDGYERVRQRLPWQTLATGEHWYTVHPFATAAAKGLVDILQPDLAYVGGLTAGVKICHLAEAHGLSVITHGGMYWPWGQHLAYAMPAIPVGERIAGVMPPGVPLAEVTFLPGTPVVEDGHVRPSDAPGFGLEITKEWVESKVV